MMNTPVRLFVALRLFMLPMLAMTAYAGHAQSCPKWGPYAGAVESSGRADLMMADVMVPLSGMAPFTYSCVIQFKLGKSGGYCGIQDGDGSDSVRPFNNIFSVWDYPNKIQIRDTYKDPSTFVGGFGNEGTGLHSHCDFGWQPDHWYTNVVRRWWDGGKTTQVAYFIYDQTRKKWRHYVTFAVPEENAYLDGHISSFLENFADDGKRTRTTYYRAYWKLLADGRWAQPDSINTDAGVGNWNSSAYGDDGISLSSCGKEAVNGEKKSFPVRLRAATPAFATGEIYDLGAYYDLSDKTVHIDWSIVDSAAPQLSYELKIFDAAGAGATPIASVSGYGPEIREKVLSVPGLFVDKKEYFIVLTIKDIFNHYSEPKTIIVSRLKS
jgi:hypothetical protein